MPIGFTPLPYGGLSTFSNVKLGPSGLGTGGASLGNRALGTGGTGGVGSPIDFSPMMGFMTLMMGFMQQVFQQFMPGGTGQTPGLLSQTAPGGSMTGNPLLDMLATMLMPQNTPVQPPLAATAEGAPETVQGHQASAAPSFANAPQPMMAPMAPLTPMPSPSSASALPASPAPSNPFSMAQPQASATNPIAPATGIQQPVVAQSPVAGGTANQKIAQMAEAYRGRSSSHGPAGGFLACAFMVNNVLKDAVGYKLGANPNAVGSVLSDLAKGKGTKLNPQQAQPGDIAIITKDASKSGQSHIGIVTQGPDGKLRILSNDSYKKGFVLDQTFDRFAGLYPGGQFSIWRLNDQGAGAASGVQADLAATQNKAPQTGGLPDSYAPGQATADETDVAVNDNQGTLQANAEGREPEALPKALEAQNQDPKIEADDSAPELEGEAEKAPNKPAEKAPAEKVPEKKAIEKKDPPESKEDDD